MSSNPSPDTLTPLFAAQQVVCAYPISDVYASTPRYLYYALILASIVVRTRSWLANVFLGAAAAYAGTAAIEAFVLISNQPYIYPDQQVTIPFINSADVDNNATLSALDNLVTDSTYIDISPAAMEFDIDAILAITVTGYLVMLPMHCWSGTVRSYRARHLLIGMWNALMLAGSICALVLWPSLNWNNFPSQYRFCYPQFPDGDSASNDGWDDDLWRGDWNSSVWNVFANLTANFELNQNCFYPCFNTSAVMRQPSSITANLNVDSSPRTNVNLTSRQYAHYDHLTTYMYIALALATLTALFLLALNVTNLRRLTRVPVHKPQLLWVARKELWHSTVGDLKTIVFGPSKTPHPTTNTTTTTQLQKSTPNSPSPKQSRRTPHRRQNLLARSKALARLVSDAFALLILILATVLIPVVNIVFIVWIEWFIHRDIVSKETPQQVGQWSSLAAIGLVLVSAAVLRVRYRIASTEELQTDVERYREKMRVLEGLVAVRLEREREHDEGEEVAGRGEGIELGIREGLS